MKISPVTFAALFLIPSAAFAADPADLYTRVTPPSDPTPATLIANGTFVWGDRFSNNTVLGSKIVVNDANLEQETGTPASVSSISGVHVPIHSRRTDTADITRWYQKDGNVQIFRLFQGENNYRFDIPAEAPPSRVEAVSPTLAVAPGTWRVWEATYTIVDPLGANIFQLFHTGSDLWSFHLDMNAAGDIYFIRRNSIPGLPDRITIAENRVGKSLSLRVRANGYNYEVYKKIPFVDASWVLVTIGQYQQSPTDEVTFRWGMYPGSQPGATSKNGLLFVSGAATSVSSSPAVPPPATYYWDNNGANPGFGTAAGTWAAPATGSATQGWNADETGATLPANVTTRTFDTVNFGSGATGLAAGAITVSGAVTSGNMSFASGTGAITLNGGSIAMPAETTISLAGSAVRTINSAIGGASDGFSVAGSGTLVLNGSNAFNGPVVIGNNVNNITVRINSIADQGSAASPSSLGAPTSAAKGLIQIGSGSRSSTLEFTGAGAAASTNRQVRIGSDSNGSGSATILNNDADAADTLTFSNAAFNLAAPAVASNFSRGITLGGSNTGDNTIAGAIVNNGSSKVGLNKSGTGTWLLSGASSYSGTTNVNAGTLKIGAANVLPSGSGKGNLSVNGGTGTSSRGTLDLNGFNLAVNGLGGSSNTSPGRALNNATGTVSTLTLGNDDAGGTFNGILADGTGTLALTKTGTGIQTLNGHNTHSGNTTISQGTLALGETGSISDSRIIVRPGATLDTTARSSFVIPAVQPLAFRVEPAGTGSSGTLVAAGLDITTASVAFELAAALDDPVYILATYTNLSGSAFASIAQLPAGYSLNYAYEGNKIALVRNPPSVPTVLFSDNFDGDPAAALDGTTPDITTGANWVAMNNATNGRIRADGTIDVAGGVSANRGGSATLAFTPQDGFIYKLDLSALNLNSSSSNTTANRLYFGFAKGQSAGNGAGNRLQVTDATVQGQITQGFMTKVGYSTTTNPNTGLGGIENASFNDASSTAEWSSLATAFGGSIDLRIVLDTSIPGNWTATWFAKRPTTQSYSVTRATGPVNTSDIDSVGFGLNTITSGRVSAFTLTRAEPSTAFTYETWADGAGFGDDANGDGVSNGLAFLLGAEDPAANALDLLPAIQEINGGLQLTFTVRNPASRGSAMLSLQYSNDLGISDPWTSVAVPDQGGATISDGVVFFISPIPETVFNSVQATIPDSAAEGGKLFGRLAAGGP